MPIAKWSLICFCLTFISTYANEPEIQDSVINPSEVLASSTSSLTKPEIASTTILPIMKSPKKQIFLFKPNIINPLGFDELGISYREHSKKTFYDFEFLQHSWSDVMRSDFRFQTATFSEGIITNTKYIQFYVLGGAGLTHCSASFGALTRNIYALLTGKFGFTFKYGFIDLGLNIPLPSLKWQKYTESGDPFSGSTSIRENAIYFAIPVSRAGIGFTF